MILADWLVITAGLFLLIAIVVAVLDAIAYTHFTHEDPMTVAIDSWETDA
jgi:hypothetical protein